MKASTRIKRMFALAGALVMIGSLLFSLLLVLPVAGQPDSVAQGPLASATATTFTLTRLTDNAAEDTRPTLAVDDNGQAHVVYERDGDIYHATNAGGTWSANPIASSADDQYRPAIALDASGHAHVAYFSGAPPSLDLIYATNAGGTWATEIAGTVAMPATWNLHLGLALNGAGRPYIVYHYYVEYVEGTPAHHQIALRYRESSRGTAPQGGWTTLLVTEHTADSEYPSIAVDGAGVLHVAYAGLDPLDPTAFYPEIWHATYSGSAWSYDRLTHSTWKTDAHPSLALDSNHKAHIAWQVSDMGTSPDIVYGTNASGSWITTTLTANAGHDTHPSLTLDGQAHAHIVYQYTWNNNSVNYASNASGAWLTDTVASPTVTGTYLAETDDALAVDDAGYLHVTYCFNDGDDDEVGYARSDQPVVSPDNQPPNTPANPVPCHPCTGVGVEDNVLSWSGGDPDAGDTVTYDVFFGDSNPPPVLQSDWPTTTLTVTLAADTHYHWYVSAHDDHGAETDGPLWEFTTGSNYKVFLPLAIR